MTGRDVQVPPAGHGENVTEAVVGCDLLVEGTVATMDGERRTIEDAAIAVRDGAIVEIGLAQALRARYRPARHLGGTDAIVLPGMIDTHTHCSQCFVRSLTANELPMIPRVYVPAQRALDAAQVDATVRLIAAQMLRAGVTTICDGTLIPGHEEATIEALRAVGIRCSFARGAGDQDFDHASLYRQYNDRSWVKAREGEAARDLLRTEALLARFPAGGKQRIRAAVTASAVLGYSREYFEGASALARRHGTTLQVHVGRDREEVEFSLAVWGRRPVERLADCGVIDEHLVAVHAVLASGPEIALLAAGRAALAHSPMECVYNLNAVPDIQRFRLGGCTVGLGCDNQGNDMFATMRAALLIHGAVWGIPRYDAEYLSADDVLAMATCDAARVLKWDDHIGSLEVGKAADFVVLDGAAPHLMARQDLVTDVVRFASRAEVLQTVVGGDLLYDRGEFPTIDVGALRRDAAAGAAFVREQVAGRRYKPLR